MLRSGLKIASVVKVEHEVDDEPDAGGGDGGPDEELLEYRPMGPVRWDEWTRREPQTSILASERKRQLYALH